MRIGLTGGIASGKSTAASWFSACGVAVVDADAIARDLTAPRGAATELVCAEFGAVVLGSNGQLDRSRLRAVVLAKPSDRRRLETILHPLIQEKAEAFASAAEHQGKSVVFDIPLLVESGHWASKVERVLLIDCDECVQVKRAQARPGWSVEQVQAVISAQASRAQRRAAADACIDNSEMPLERLHQSLQELAQHWGLPGLRVKESRP